MEPFKTIKSIPFKIIIKLFATNVHVLYAVEKIYEKSLGTAKDGAYFMKRRISTLSWDDLIYPYDTLYSLFFKFIL